MKYYFDSKFQVDGDKAYNRGDFQTALKSYTEGLKVLYQVATSSRFKANAEYYDELAFVLYDVIFTKLRIIKANSESDECDFEVIDDLWKTIVGQLHELNTIYKEVTDYEDRQITQGKIDEVYKLLVNVCEGISDTLFDAQTVDGMFKPEDLILKHSLLWLKRSIDYRQEAELSVDVMNHIGYLYILEQRYKCSKEKQRLVEINDYIKNHDLLNFSLNPLQRIEILGYQLLVAVENKDLKIGAQLIETYNTLVETLDEENIGSPAFKDTKELQDKLILLLEEAKLSNVNDDEDEVRLHLKNQKKRKKIIDDSSDDESTSLPNKKTTTQQEKQQETIIKSNFAQQQDFLFFVNSVSEELSEEPQFKQFAIDALKDLASHYKQPAFLANLLSLVGDFYYYTENLPLIHQPLIMTNLFKSVLMISDTHQIAKYRLKDILNKYPNANSDSEEQDSQIRDVVDNLSSEKVAEQIFNQTLDKHVLSLKTLSFGDKEKEEAWVTQLIKYVASNLESKKIAGSQSSKIAAELSSKYEELVRLHREMNFTL